MLDALRRAAQGWVAKSLLVLLVGSFAVWGLSSRMMHGLGGNTVVSAGDTVVTPAEYRLAWNSQVGAISQQFGQQLTRDQARSFGIDDQVLAQAAAGAVLDEQAREMRLGVTEERLAQQTVENPIFRAGAGFDRNRFNYVLRQVGMTERDYFRNQEQVAVRQQITEAISDGMAAPDTFLRAASLYAGEDRTVDYLVLPPSLVDPIEEPSAEALDKFFADNKATYAAPEYRKFSFVKLEAEDIADVASITDEQARQSYDQNIARYTTPETRVVEQLVFPSRDEAQKALDAIRGGKTFETVVSEQKKSMADVSLGALTKDRINDQKVADAAFALQQGAVSDVVDSAFGPVLLRAPTVTPAEVKPFDAVSAEIKKTLATNDAGTALSAAHNTYQDARAGGATMQEAASRIGLKVMTVEAMDREARRPDGSVVNDLPISQELVAAVFDADQGVENEGLPTVSGGSVFYEVDGITPARDRALDEVRERVVNDWKAAERTARLKKRADDYAKRLSDGSATLEAIATEASLEKQTKRGLKREADDGDFGREGVQAIYAVADNKTGSFDAPNNGGRVLFHVVESIAPAGAGPEALSAQQRNTYAQGMGNDLLDQMISQLETKYTVQINRAAAEQALGETPR
ncbi:MAG: SurA N-terminal domain-containing protein [Methylobacterium mesophilicum]|nr:SurA N-terminal domain-containing protein [Methylobacterium mesophilicum]